MKLFATAYIWTSINVHKYLSVRNPRIHIHSPHKHHIVLEYNLGNLGDFNFQVPSNLMIITMSKITEQIMHTKASVFQQ